MPRSWPVAAKIAAIAEAGVKATDCMPGGDGAVRPCKGELEQVVDRRAEDAADGVLAERRFREDGLAVSAALEVAVGRLLVAAHVRLEDRALAA